MWLCFALSYPEVAEGRPPPAAERERQSVFNLQDWLTSHYNQTHTHYAGTQTHKFMYKCTGPHADICTQHTLSHSRGGSVIMPWRSSQAYLPSSSNQVFLCIYFQTVCEEHVNDKKRMAQVSCHGLCWITWVSLFLSAISIRHILIVNRVKSVKLQL